MVLVCPPNMSSDCVGFTFENQCVPGSLAIVAAAYPDFALTPEASRITDLILEAALATVAQ